MSFFTFYLVNIAYTYQSRSIVARRYYWGYSFI